MLTFDNFWKIQHLEHRLLQLKLQALGIQKVIN